MFLSSFFEYQSFPLGEVFSDAFDEVYTMGGVGLSIGVVVRFALGVDLEQIGDLAFSEQVGGFF